MKLRTEVTPASADFHISHETKVLMIGSCFAQNIGAKLRSAKFNVHQSSHGIVFNPYSVNQAILDMMGDVRYGEEELFHWEGSYLSFNHQKRRNENAQALLDEINIDLRADFEFIQDAAVVFITLGSAWAYKHQTHGIVANCHKVPGNQFEKVKLGVNDIVSQFSRTLEHLFSLNSQLEVVLSVSPVRHWKDGAIENQWSKSTLNVAAHELVRRFENVSYFPSYELLMDDLRDYRFYNEDLLHPNNVAINYVWEKFQQTYFTGHTKDGVDLIEKWMKGFNHRPATGNDQARTRNVSGLLERAHELEADFEIDLSEEKARLSYELNDLLKV